jgi:hypothetical protein
MSHTVSGRSGGKTASSSAITATLRSASMGAETSSAIAHRTWGGVGGVKGGQKQTLNPKETLQQIMKTTLKKSMGAVTSRAATQCTFGCGGGRGSQKQTLTLIQ